MGIEESLVALVQAVVPLLAGLIYAAIGAASFASFAVLNLLVLIVIYRSSKALFLRIS
jgi:hypothetical protein